MRSCLWLLVLAIGGAMPAPAAPAPSVGNLGDSLLDESLAEALAPPAVDEAKDEEAAKPVDWLPQGDALQKLLEQGALETAGEDVGGSPLASVVRDMRRAEGLIRDDADEKAATPVQREVVTQLERLIAQMEKQCSGGSCNKPSDKQNKQASKRSQPKPGQCDKPGQCNKPGQATKTAGKSANQSGQTSNSALLAAESAEGRQELLKAAWGHLPERVREQMLQGSDSEFHPEYREELQQYFQRLAERSSQEAP